MGDTIIRHIDCNVKGCNGKPKKTIKTNDSLSTELCAQCEQVVSYTRPEALKEGKKSKVAKAPPQKKLKQEIELAILTGDIEINKEYNEKCEATMSRMGNASVDYIFTSPPYNVGSGVDGHKYGGENSFSDNMSQQQYYEWNVKLVNEFLRVTKNHVFYNNQILTNNKAALFTLIGHFADKIKELIIWDKTKRAPASAPGMLDSEFELMIVFSNIDPHSRVFPDANFAGNKGTGLSNILRVRPTKNTYADINKAVFPLNLPRTVIRAFGKKGSVWYDPFGGTGTTAEACIMEERNWILSEMSKDSVIKAIKPRVKNAKSKITLKFEEDEE